MNIMEDMIRLDVDFVSSHNLFSLLDTIEQKGPITYADLKAAMKYDSMDLLVENVGSLMNMQAVSPHGNGSITPSKYGMLLLELCRGKLKILLLKDD